MAIGTGSVSMSQINTELGRAAGNTISLDSAENGSYAAINQCSPSRPSSDNPASISEWRGYNHSFACCNAPSISAGNTATNSLGVAISYSNCSTMHIEYSSNYGSSWSTNTGGCTSYATISSLASGTTYLIRVRITCTSTGGYSGYSNTISMSTGASCAAYGTYLSQYCSGCTLYYRYANGSCGTYDVSQGCTTACGGCCCSPANGTYLEDNCIGCEYYYVYSDGCNGTYSVLQDSNSPNCGCGGGGRQCFTYYSDGGGSWEGLDCTGRRVSGYAYYYGQELGCLQEIAYGGYNGGEICGDPNCPTPDMPILIAPNTWVMAGDLQVGDYVYTKHQTTGEWGSYQVSKVQPGTNIVSSTIIGGKEIKVSSNHRFLTESMGFVPLSELWVGAKVQTIDGLAEIESIEEIGELPVIQIEVDDAHTYVIRDVVSHNRKLEPI
jgi:hypothetical protein